MILEVEDTPSPSVAHALGVTTAGAFYSMDPLTDSCSAGTLGRPPPSLVRWHDDFADALAAAFSHNHG
jgi:hypothetical protein